MNRTYIEQLIVSDQRTRERNMLFAALRQRRGHIFRRPLITSLFWLFGIR